MASREEVSVKALEAPIEIDTTVKFNIKQSNQIAEKKYKCTCCGASWNDRKRHFTKSASPLYKSNDGFLNICNTCRDAWYYKLVDFYNGNESHAIRHFCQQFDIVFHTDALSASRQISADRSRISHYCAKKNLGQTLKVGTTYIDSMKHDYLKKQDEVIESVEQAKSDESSVTMSAIDRWGIGYAELDYKILDEHYKMLKKNNPNADSNQEIFIKTLCELNMLKIKAMRTGDSDKVIKLTDQYSKTFKAAGLKTISDDGKNVDDCWGIFMEQISQYTPEEYYKDKKLYKDFDKIGEIYQRFVLRPLKNILTGDSERDYEYNVEDDVDGKK